VVDAEGHHPQLQAWRVRACSPVTAALLASPPPNLRSADLFTFTLLNGAVYRWTGYDRDITVEGNTWGSRKPWLERSRWSIANTMQVPTLEVFLRALDDGFAGGTDIKGQLTNGLFDGAAMTLDRVFFAAGNVGSNGAVSLSDAITTTIAGTTVLAYNALVSLGWWQGTFEQGLNDEATMGVAFFDHTGAQLGVTKWAPVIATPSGMWTARSLNVVAPAGSATFRIYMQMVRRTGTSNDGRIDDVTFNLGSTSLTITNPGAESASMTGWTTDIGSPAATPGSPGDPAHSGNYFFYGGATAALSQAHQDLALVSIGAVFPGIRLFGGRVADMEIVGNQATINVKGKVNLLDQYAPRNLYQLGCEHAFCDAGCTLNRAAYTTSYTVGSSTPTPTRTFIPWTSAPSNPGRYRYGTVTFTSGDCAGQARTVRSADSTGLTLTHPLIGYPLAGDAFTAFEGCDKQRSSGSGQDCTARSNTQNWRGFPYVPPADSAV
jgi:hypothetical protein